MPEKSFGNFLCFPRIILQIRRQVHKQRRTIFFVNTIIVYGILSTQTYISVGGTCPLPHTVVCTLKTIALFMSLLTLEQVKSIVSLCQQIQYTSVNKSHVFYIDFLFTFEKVSQNKAIDHTFGSPCTLYPPTILRSYTASMKYKLIYRVSNNYCPIRFRNTNELIGQELWDTLYEYRIHHVHNVIHNT